MEHYGMTFEECSVKFSWRNIKKIKIISLDNPFNQVTLFFENSLFGNT